MNANTLGEFVAALRQEKGLTQKQLADRLGVTDKAVSRWEKGKNYPDIELLEPIAREFEVTVNELISGRRLGSGEILPESDSNIVHIIKINRRQKRIFSMVLALLLVFILILGLYTIGRFSGLNSQPVRKTYDIYQNYLTAVLKEIEGRIYELSSGEGSWDTLYISEADVLFSPEKEINASAPMVSHLSVICSVLTFISSITKSCPHKVSYAITLSIINTLLVRIIRIITDPLEFNVKIPFPYVTF